MSMAQPLASELGLDIVRVRIMGGNKPQLQIMIEKQGGAATDVEDCATFSRTLSPVLETEDPITEAYRLEVSTPGIDRPLTRVGDFGRWAGHLTKIELIMPLEGRRRFQGIISREDENGVAILLDDDSELVAQVHEMSKASLILTDELIDAATSDGTLPPQPGDEEFEGFETEEAEPDTIEDNQESGA